MISFCFEQLLPGVLVFVRSSAKCALHCLSITLLRASFWRRTNADKTLFYVYLFHTQHCKMHRVTVKSLIRLLVAHSVLIVCITKTLHNFSQLQLQITTNVI